jgi:hypothetical protein
MQIPAWVSAFFRYFNQLLGIVTGIQAAQAQQASKAEQDLILANTNRLITDVEDATNGLTAIKNAVNDLATLVGTNDTAILAAIGTPQQAGDPVTLPATPPTGYAPPSAAENSDAVWGYTNFGLLTTTYGFLTNAGTFPIQLQALGAIPIMQNPMFGLAYDWGDAFVVGQPSDRPIGDITTILADDDVVTWLNRTSGFDGGWAINSNGGVWNESDFSEEGAWVFYPGVDGFNQIKAHLFPPTPPPLPPVWPGLAGVTLGTPVDISTGVTITAAMDGVLIDITSAPLKQGFFTFDTAISYRNIGALAFVSDNGQEEFPQTLGFTSAVYCPKTMQHAAGLVFRSSADLTGTITPWTLA